MHPVLQSRWKISGRFLVYYGLRKKPHTFRNRIRVGPGLIGEIRRMDGARELSEFKKSRALAGLIRQGVVVDREERRRLPDSLSEARFCRKCCLNDFVLPGLELDGDGLCPICADAKASEKLSSVIPVKSRFQKADGSRFDVALLYTGGKDSSYVLYRLAKEQGLRVLALTWDIPFMTDNARQSMENAKKRLPGVEFVSKKIDRNTLAAVYRKLYGLQGNTCACPSLAYVLFYPTLVREKIPYVVVGDEPAQARSLLYSGMAPRIAYTFGAGEAAGFFIGLMRMLSFRRPLRPGQYSMLMTVRQLAYGRHPLLRLSGYQNELIDNVCRAVAEAPELLAPLKEAIRESERCGTVPALVHFGFGGSGNVENYRWDRIKELLREELGWVDIPQSGKGLHTSCEIERCKEYAQFIRFRNMESRIPPFSAVELAVAVGRGSVSREEAVRELAASGMALAEPHETEIMKAAFQI